MPEITMPQAGQSMEEGTIVAWLKSVGDSVEEGEVIAEIETDKAVIEFESPASGPLVEILRGEGETVPVHTPIAVIGEPGAGTPSKSAVSRDAEPAAPPGGVVPILLPQLGQTMEEGTLVEWLVGPGDRIETGQVIFEVETDKAAVEVEATDSGRLARIVVEEGETVPVKSVVAYLAERDEDVDAYMAAAPAGAEKQPAAESAVSKPVAVDMPAEGAVAPPAATGRPKASPAARKAARELGIGLTAVGKGSGPGGRILSGDVEKAQREPSAAPPAAGEALGRPLSRMRRAIAASLTLSARTIPHFYAAVTVDAGPLVEFRARRKAKSAATVNDIIVWCVARALREFPALRSRIDGDNLVEMPSANIGVAVATGEGLVVPVLRRADQLTLEELAAESRRIVAAARGGRLEGAGQGVFTVTNLGMYGLDEFAAIINPGEAAILAVGAIREAPVARDGQLRAGRVMTLRLSADHRIIDGATAAEFLGRVRGLLEEARFGS